MSAAIFHRVGGQACHGVMKSGTALMNTPWVHADFPGDYEGPDTSMAKRGQTICNIGPAIEVAVLKCSACGYSVRA